MAQHNADETKILDSKAVIYKNEYGVWQFRYWLTTENKYVRKSLRTKVKTKAKEDAEDLYFKIRVEQKEGRRYFAISVKQAVEDFLNYQKTRIGEGDFNIVEGRFKTIETQMNTFLEYVRKDDKITDLDENTLRRYERNGAITNYPKFRKDKGIKDVTIRNEMTTFNSFVKYCYSFSKVTHIASFHYPNMPKKNYTADGEVIRRMTFTVDEWRKFYKAMDDIYTAKKHTKHLTADDIFERQLVRHYFLFAANSGLRSSELRKLEWHNVSTFDDTTSSGRKLVLADLLVEKKTSKVRKNRRVISRGGEYIRRWKSICKEHNKQTEGIVFSVSGKEYSRSNTHKHFRKILSLTDIDDERQRALVPYSLRHFMITERVKSGLSFNQIAIMCGTSTRQIENTYLHLNDEMLRTSAVADYINKDGKVVVV